MKNSTPSLLRSLVAPALLVAVATASDTARAAPDLDILASAGLGDDLGGRPVALDLTSDGVVIASESDGRAALIQIDPVGAQRGAARPLVGRVDDLAVDRGSGRVIVVDGDGVAAFDAELAPLWRRALVGDARRLLAVGEHGTIAVHTAGALHTFDGDGRPLGEVALADDAVVDLAVVDAADLVVTVGTAARVACDEPISVASLAAFDRDGAPRWRAYGDTTSDALCGLASTRGVAVARGDDGLVYFLAEVDAGEDVFRGRPGEPGRAAANVAFDRYTDRETAHPARSAYFARFSVDGEHLLGQYFLLPADGSVVRPREIAADEHGNVHLVGATSHSLGAADELALTEPLDHMTGFYQVVEPDFEARRVWHELDADDMRSELAKISLAGDRIVTLLDAAATSEHSEHSLPPGPSIVMWPGGHGPVPVEKRPDPETQGTFGYESGVSGSDPTCYCDSSETPGPAALLTLASLTLASVQRPRRRAQKAK